MRKSVIIRCSFLAEGTFCLGEVFSSAQEIVKSKAKGKEVLFCFLLCFLVLLLRFDLCRQQTVMEGSWVCCGVARHESIVMSSVKGYLQTIVSNLCDCISVPSSNSKWVNYSISWKINELLFVSPSFLAYRGPPGKGDWEIEQLRLSIWALVLVCFEGRLKPTSWECLCLVGVETYCSALGCISGKNIAVVCFAVLSASW